MMGGGMSGGMGGGWGVWLMVLGLVLLVIVVVWAIAGGVRSPKSGDSVPGSASAESPKTVLDRRYAAGEIDDEEYARRRQRLDER